MAQFRLKAVSQKGKLVNTEFEASNKKEARSKVDRLSKSTGLKVHALEKKVHFIYKIKKSGNKIITGEQEAYDKDELERALTKLGYEIVSVNKKLFNLSVGIPMSIVVTFIRQSSDLLKQQLKYDEILDLLHEDTTNKRMKGIIKEIQKDLKEGKEGANVYGKHHQTFGKFATYMLSVASTSGNMAHVFDNTAKFLEREAEFKKNLRRSLMMPTIAVIAVVGVILFYVGYVFPETALLFVEVGITLPPMTQATLDFSYWLNDNWIGIVVIFLGSIIGFIWYAKTVKGRIVIDKLLIKLPVIGDLIHKTCIEIFSRVFYTLYSGSGHNIEALRIASQACRNKYMEKQINEVAIKKMLKDGAGLIESIQETGVFTPTALSRFRLGAESGALKENAKQLADYYETLTTYKLQSVIEIINLFINLFIMVTLVVITIISSETAIIKPEF